MAALQGGVSSFAASFGAAVASFAGAETAATLSVANAADGAVVALPIASLEPATVPVPDLEKAGAGAQAIVAPLVVPITPDAGDTEAGADDGMAEDDGASDELSGAGQTPVAAAAMAVPAPLAMPQAPVAEASGAALAEEAANVPQAGRRGLRDPAAGAPVTAAGPGQPVATSENAQSFADAAQDGQSPSGNAGQGTGATSQNQPSAQNAAPSTAPSPASPFAPTLAAPVAKGQPVPAPYAAPPPPVVQAHSAHFGRDIGVEIARGLNSGKEHLLIRLSPQDMGRVDVQMSFGEHGSLRAVVATESPAALDLLRREVPELARTLADAGVRTDAQSFRFDSRDDGSAAQRFRADSGAGQGEGRGGQNTHGQPGGFARGSGGDGQGQGTGLPGDHPAYRRLRASSQIDLMA